MEETRDTPCIDIGTNVNDDDIDTGTIEITNGNGGIVGTEGRTTSSSSGNGGGGVSAAEVMEAGSGKIAATIPSILQDTNGQFNRETTAMVADSYRDNLFFRRPNNSNTTAIETDTVKSDQPCGASTATESGNDDADIIAPPLESIINESTNKKPQGEVGATLVPAEADSLASPPTMVPFAPTNKNGAQLKKLPGSTMVKGCGLGQKKQAEAKINEVKLASTALAPGVQAATGRGLGKKSNNKKRQSDPEAITTSQDKQRETKAAAVPGVQAATGRGLGKNRTHKKRQPDSEALSTSQEEERKAHAAAVPTSRKPGANTETGRGLRKNNGPGRKVPQNGDPAVGNSLPGLSTKAVPAPTQQPTTDIQGRTAEERQAKHEARNVGLRKNAPPQSGSENAGYSIEDAKPSYLPYLTEYPENQEDALQVLDALEVKPGAVGSSTPPLALLLAEIDPPNQMTPNVPFPPTSDDAGLAVARPVQDDTSSLMEAQEVDPEEIQRKEIKEAKERECRWIGFTIIATCCLVLALALGFTLVKKDKTKTLSIVPTVAPSGALSGAPSSAPTGALDQLLEDLPTNTLESLKTYLSPQWQARVWLENHPDLPGMEVWRKKQLFALSTFYYAMEGPEWPKDVQDRWLQYDLSECFWFSNLFGWFEEGTYEEDLYNMYNGTPCSQSGVFQNLNLDGLGVSGIRTVLPPEISFLSSLESLVLDRSGIEVSFADFMPSELYQMTNLSVLGLSFNSLSGPIPSELGLLPNMAKLWLFHNNLSGPLPSELGKMTSMVDLSLHRNALTGPIPTELGLLNSTTWLYLYGNNLSGPIPSELGMITTMVDLTLDQNALTGPLPTELGLLTSMTELWLHDNSLTGSIPSELGMMAAMVDMSLHQNALTGRIPTELGLLTSMTVLYLRTNSLAGAIPSELGMMASMVELSLHENALTGPIPTELGLLTNMTELWLIKNNLTGPIPSELGMVTTMIDLELNQNALTGPIPSELGLLSELQLLRVENNALSGAIPEWLDALAFYGFLETLTLANNSLSGTVPEGLCSMGLFDTTLQWGLSFDCGDQLCGCCWCPCLGSNVSGTECQTHPLPGLFPTTNANGSIAIAINIRTDDYPEDITLEWSVYGGPGYWELLDAHSPEEASSVHSFTELVESDALYRLQIFDSHGDGISGNGWFNIADSTPSPDHAIGSVVWHAAGSTLESSLDVFLWIDPNGHALQVEHLPERGYALIQDESDLTGGDPIIVVSEAVTNSTNGE